VSGASGMFSWTCIGQSNIHREMWGRVRGKSSVEPVETEIPLRLKKRLRSG
jgi:hypothetical protein